MSRGPHRHPKPRRPMIGARISAEQFDALCRIDRETGAQGLSNVVGRAIALFLRVDAANRVNKSCSTPTRVADSETDTPPRHESAPMIHA